jgi:hypothetical protein
MEFAFSSGAERLTTYSPREWEDRRQAARGVNSSMSMSTVVVIGFLYLVSVGLCLVLVGATRSKAPCTVSQRIEERDRNLLRGTPLAARRGSQRDPLEGD